MRYLALTALSLLTLHTLHAQPQPQPTLTPLTIDIGSTGENICGSAAIWKPGVTGYEPLGNAPYNTLRYSTAFTCTVPGVSNGFYLVDVQLIEPNKTAKGQRAFTVTVNGTTSPTFDLFALAGPKTPYTYTVAVANNNGPLTVSLRASIGNAVLSGLVIRPVVIGPLPAPPAPPVLGPQLGQVKEGSVQLGDKWIDLHDQTRQSWMGAQPVITSGSRDVPVTAIVATTKWHVLISNDLQRISEASFSNGSFLSGMVAGTVTGGPNTFSVAPGLPLAVTRNGLRLAPSEFTFEWPDPTKAPTSVTVPSAQPGDVILVDFYLYGVDHD